MKRHFFKLLPLVAATAATTMASNTAGSFDDISDLLGSFSDGGDGNGELKNGTHILVSFNGTSFTMLRASMWSRSGGCALTVSAGNSSEYANIEFFDGNVFVGGYVEEENHAHHIGPRIVLQTSNLTAETAAFGIAFPPLWNYYDNTSDPAPNKDNAAFYDKWIEHHGFGPFRFETQKCLGHAQASKNTERFIRKSSGPVGRKGATATGDVRPIEGLAGLFGLKNTERFIRKSSGPGGRKGATATGDVRPVEGLAGLFGLLTHGSDVLFDGMQMSMSMFPDGEGRQLFFAELNARKVNVGPSLGTAGDWFFAGADDDAWGIDTLTGTFEEARVVVPDPQSSMTPWMDVFIKDVAVSWKIVFPLWFDYTTTPPTRIQSARDFFWAWVGKNGFFFVNSE